METRRNLLKLATLAGASVFTIAAAPLRSGRDALPTIETRPEPPSPPLREGVAAIGSARLAWWDTGGKGPVVVLLHPATGSGQIWRYQQQAFVRAGFRTIGYSRRGAAGSTAGDANDPMSAADDLRALMLHLGVPRFHLVGTAAGAFTAVDYAIKFQDTLRSLTLANSLLSISGGEMEGLLQGIRSTELRKFPVEMRELGPAYRVANPAGTERWLELVKGSAEEANPGSMMRAPRSQISLEGLRAIRLPVLLISGDADMFAPPPLMHVFTRYLPNTRFVTLPACGHSGYWETPDLFNEAVMSFVRSVRA